MLQDLQSLCHYFSSICYSLVYKINLALLQFVASWDNNLSLFCRVSRDGSRRGWARVPARWERPRPCWCTKRIGTPSPCSSTAPYYRSTTFCNRAWIWRPAPSSTCQQTRRLWGWDCGGSRSRGAAATSSSWPATSVTPARSSPWRTSSTCFRVGSSGSGWTSRPSWGRASRTSSAPMWSTLVQLSSLQSKMWPWRARRTRPSSTLKAGRTSTRCLTWRATSTSCRTTGWKKKSRLGSARTRSFIFSTRTRRRWSWPTELSTRRISCLWGCSRCDPPRPSSLEAILSCPRRCANFHLFWMIRLLRRGRDWPGSATLRSKSTLCLSATLRSPRDFLLTRRERTFQRLSPKNFGGPCDRSPRIGLSSTCSTCRALSSPEIRLNLGEHFQWQRILFLKMSDDVLLSVIKF